MKIVADNAIPFLRGVFEPYAEVIYKDGDGICQADLRNADALLPMTRTRCSSELLQGGAVRLIATASIGTDHIDIPYCQEHGIYVQNAPGSNAGGVMNYVFSALFACAARKAVNIMGSTIGIVGVGNCGSRVRKMASYLGMKTLCYDPPRAEAEGPDGFVSLEQLLAGSDVVTMHVPLNRQTHHMAGADFFAAMKPGAIFINTARGEVVDEKALKAYIPRLGGVIIDTWENEPGIDRDLVEMVDIATPHIAGYSYQGKQNVTSAVVRAVARFFGISQLFEFFPEAELSELESIKLDLKGMNMGEIAAILQYNYPIFTDDFMFRIAPGDFQKIRRDYRYRREYYVDY